MKEGLPDINNKTGVFSEGKLRFEEELIDRCSDNPTKVNISVQVINYVNDKKRKQTDADPWNFSNFALRQMHAASRRGPRLRYLPGTYVSGMNARPTTAQLTATFRERHLSALPTSNRAISAGGQICSGRPRSRLLKRSSIQSPHLGDCGRGGALGSEAGGPARSETSLLAEEMVGRALPSAALEVQLHNLACYLTQNALELAVKGLLREKESSTA